MAVAPAFEFAVPSPHDAFFTQGEKAVSVSAAPGGAAARTNYFLSTWADLEGGEYLIRVFAVQASTWATSITVNNVRVFLNTPRDVGPHVATINLPRGRQRIDVLLSNLSASAGSCYMAFSLWRQGRLVYKSEAAPWVFDTAPIPDASLPEPVGERLTLPVFAVQPNWADPIIERLMYSTEVLSSESDVEQRRSLRTTPRRSFEMSFARHGAIRSRVDTFLAGVGRNRVLVPMWHEQVILQSALSSTLSIADGTIAMREFRDDGLVIVTANNPALYEVLTIDTVNMGTGLITFTAAPVGSWPAGSRVMPLRQARVSESGSLNNVTDAVGTVQVRFDLADAEGGWYSPSWGHDTPLWQFPLERGQQMSVAHNRATAFVTDDEYGPVDVFDLDQKTRLNIRAAVTLIGRARVFAFRQFIDMARGRAVRFWMPSFMSDIQPLSGVSGTTFDIQSIGSPVYMKTAQDYRAQMLIEFIDGRPSVYSAIDSVQRISDTVDRVTVATSLAAATNAEIARVSFLLPVRFDQDLFELQHLVDGSAAVRTSVVVRTADSTGMPDAYPVE